jgi:hypothetical protein
VFDIDRNDLLDQIGKMRGHISKKTSLKEEEKDHAVPIAHMGNFQAHLMKQEALR